MKREAIEKELERRFEGLEKLFGDAFRREDYYFAGGCIYSMWNDKQPNDYDVFCKNKYAIRRLKKWFRVHKKARIITDNAISMGKYQFVTKHIGSPEVEVGKFDFLHNCYWHEAGHLHALKGWEYLDSNSLHFNSDRARDILNIMTRVPKFVDRGMSVTQAELLDILERGTRPTKLFQERRSIKRRQSGRSVY